MGRQPESNKRSLGPISFTQLARFERGDGDKKPGPGAYKDREGARVLSTKVMAGTVPFGHAERENRVCYKGMEEGFYCREGRGPGSYRVYSGLGRQVDSKTSHLGTTFGREMRSVDPKKPNYLEKQAAMVPGPGDYFSKIVAGSSAPSVSFGKSARGEDDSGLAAVMRATEAKRKPSELAVPDSLGKQTLSTKRTNSSWKFAMGQRFAPLDPGKVPGPGAYIV